MPDLRTPGPWEALPPYESAYCRPEAETTVADRCWRVVHGPTRQPVAYCRTEADARALAALPALLTALRCALRCVLPSLSGWARDVACEALDRVED